jgi:uncharacterized protein YfdQ (DUF2303 family)
VNRVDPETRDIAAAINAAQDLFEAHEIAERRELVIAHPTDVKLTTFDLSEDDDRPKRAKGTVHVRTPDSFVVAVRRLADTAAVYDPLLYGDIEGRQLTAVLDDHGAGGAGWRQHRVLFRPERSEEWLSWKTNEGYHTQEQFAEAIEAGERNITNPDPIVLLEMAENFHANISARVKQAKRLRDGRTQLIYEEDINATGGEGGTVDFPNEFTIAVAPFRGFDEVEIRCRIRFRIQGGSFSIGYFLDHPDVVEREAFQSAAERAVDELGLPVLDGVA